MNDLKFLESTEFYSHRYQNFATLIIVPLAVLLCGLLLFSLFGSREITVKSVGQIQPQRTPVAIQGTSASQILENHLVENKVVHQGDKLLVYQDTGNQDQADLLNEQINTAQQRLTALNQLKDGITQNKQVFAQSDTFGYADDLDNYLNQREIYRSEATLADKTENATTTKINNVKQLLNDNLTNLNTQAKDYQGLIDTINQGKNVMAKNSSLTYEFNSYQSQSKDLSNDDLNKLKQSYLDNATQQLNQINAAINSTKVQQAQLDQPQTAAITDAQSNQKISSLQNQQLASTNKELAQIKDSLAQLQAKLATLNKDQQNYTVRAKTTGILHVAQTTSGKNYLSPGTTLAEIYPLIDDKTKLTVIVPISPDEIVGLKKGQTLRFKISQKVPRPMLINGVIEKIDVAPTVTERGNYFQVTAKINPTTAQRRNLRYGLSGSVSVVTGEKTFFNYYRDKLFNN